MADFDCSRVQNLILRTRIRLNDGPAWENLRPGQFVIFLSDLRTDVILNDEGKPAGEATLVSVFESLAEAKQEAEAEVARVPTACAAIYDHKGRSGDPVRRVYHQSVQRRYDPERRARRDAWAGGSLLVAFIIWSIAAAYSTDEHFLWFYILGMKLLVLGTILFVRGVGFFLGRR